MLAQCARSRALPDPTWYRKGNPEDPKELTVELLDSGPSTQERWSVFVIDEDGRSTRGPLADDPLVAIDFVRWNELDAD
jgi:hypothetical protein